MRSLAGPMTIAIGPVCPHHVDREQVTLYLHRPLGFINLDPALFDGRLNLLSEDLAFIGVMQICVVPLAISSLLDFLGRWQYVTYWQLNLLFLQE